MGADGGLAFAVLKEGASHERFLELVRPLDFNRYDDAYDEYHQAWLERNELSPRTYLSTYGSFQDVDGYLDLDAVLLEIERRKDELQGWTFQDVLDDILTRPAWQDTYMIPPRFEVVVMHALFLGFRDRETGYWRPYDCEQPKDPILQANVLEWAKEVRSLVEALWWEETWT